MFIPGVGTYSIASMEDTLVNGMTTRDELKLIADIGYKRVELLQQDLDTNSNEDLKKWLDEFGLEVTSVHAKPTEEIVRRMADLGAIAVIWAGTPFCSKAEALEVAAELESMAEMAEPYGIKIGYHNHTSEFYFDEGKALLEHVLDNSTKCYAQLDCGWSTCAGMYPPYFIRKYRNRIVSIHVKENAKVEGPGPLPASRHAEGAGHSMPDFSKMTAEERKAFVDGFNKMLAPVYDRTLRLQCRMGAPESNINWNDIKAALDEQDFEAFWIVEREGFYADRVSCLTDDYRWLTENIR
ncbi:MAG: sugar phosphate isomerase/epimerase [Lachnospiraceae bacterium]|nr:sugar phosphate isomerase/epimerase [Lachnospiraceae bacterium]